MAAKSPHCQKKQLKLKFHQKQDWELKTRLQFPKENDLVSFDV